MSPRTITLALACALGSCQVLAQTGTGASALTEQDFLGDVPIVLSVSRLAQRLDETPGAMTILDREFIRMTGARDVVDLLRFVPGFHTTASFETDAPMAYYHGRNDDWANRLQVLVDGRSVYSSQLQGSVGAGLQTLALEDIERIEVLRGSNSAAYGARAFLGVVNIVSRDVRDTTAPRISLRSGENGVADAGGSFGGGTEFWSYRVNVDSRGDDGLRKQFANPAQNWAQDGNRVSRANLSARWAQSGATELLMRSGINEVEAHRGTVGEEGNLERKRFITTQYLQMDWAHFLSENEDVRLSASRTEVRNRDGFPYLVSGSPFNGITIGFSGDEINDVASAQHTLRLSDDWRLAWGGELRNEQLRSLDTLDSVQAFAVPFTRLFAHAEWRFHPLWLLNMGGLWEQSDLGGSLFSPRLMMNWQLMPNHTLRAGASTAFRPPSYFEKNGQVVYRPLNPGAVNPYITSVSNPNLHAEHIVARELGYRWDAPRLGVSWDWRVFEEQITDGINYIKVDPGSGYVNQADQSKWPSKYVNSDATVNRGFEYQLEWRPQKGQRLWLTQSRTDISVLATAFDSPLRNEYAAPKSTTSLAWMQQFGRSWEVSLLYSDIRDVALMSPAALSSGGKTYDSVTRTDVRLGRTWKLGRQTMDAALVIQNLNSPYRDGDRKFFFDRRAFFTLNLGL